LVEAMMLGLPIFAFDVNYNRETTSEAAFYFRDEKQLIFLLQHLPTEINACGLKMREIASRRYTWDAISTAYAALL
jgi:glycosyltransferase involved in cell wall biosynthesis